MLAAVVGISEMFTRESGTGCFSNEIVTRPS